FDRFAGRSGESAARIFHPFLAGEQNIIKFRSDNQGYIGPSRKIEYSRRFVIVPNYANAWNAQLGFQVRRQKDNQLSSGEAHEIPSDRGEYRRPFERNRFAALSISFAGRASPFIQEDLQQ